MAYAALSDMQLRFGDQEIADVSDRTGAGFLDSSAVATALSDGANTIDAYIGGRLPLPMVAPYPPLLVRINCDLARHALYKDKAPDMVTALYKDAIDILRRIASGEVALISGITPPVNTVTIPSRASVFTDALLDRLPG